MHIKCRFKFNINKYPSIYRKKIRIKLQIEIQEKSLYKSTLYSIVVKIISYHDKHLGKKTPENCGKWALFRENKPLKMGRRFRGF